MDIESVLSNIWTFVNGILSIELPVGQYTVTYWNITIFAFLVYQVLKIMFGLATRGNKNE